MHCNWTLFRYFSHDTDLDESAMHTWSNNHGQHPWMFSEKVEVEGKKGLVKSHVIWLLSSLNSCSIYNPCWVTCTQWSYGFRVTRKTCGTSESNGYAPLAKILFFNPTLLWPSQYHRDRICGGDSWGFRMRWQNTKYRNIHLMVYNQYLFWPD